MRLWYTRPGRQIGGHLHSPNLLYLKWHGYPIVEGEHSFSVGESRTDFLLEVAESVNRTYKGEIYADWLNRYEATIRGLGKRVGSDAAATEFCEASQVWRLVIGFASNPALETGICLHHLLGVPFIPGSAVKGLLHNCAEISLIEECLPTDEVLFQPGTDARDKFLEGARFIRAVFGSLNLERPRDQGDREFGPQSPRSILRIWRENRLPEGSWEPVVTSLLSDDGNMGALVTLLDAFPQASQTAVAELDVLNPHYPEFFRKPEECPPSDDQDPIPVFFVAVPAGVRFIFPFLVSPWRRSDPMDDFEAERAAALSGWTHQEVRNKIRSWLAKGLSELGIGAKTSAGYGYFTEISGYWPAP